VRLTTVSSPWGRLGEVATHMAGDASLHTDGRGRLGYDSYRMQGLQNYILSSKTVTKLVIVSHNLSGRRINEIKVVSFLWRDE
jgi:hypothetical protein